MLLLIIVILVLFLINYLQFIELITTFSYISSVTISWFVRFQHLYLYQRSKSRRCLFKKLRRWVWGKLSVSDMAERNHTTAAPSSASMTSLGRALSRSRLSQPEGFQSQKSRSAAGQTRRRYSSSSESPDISPNVEARVLVINTGGTIGMTYHNNGKLYQHRSHTWLHEVHIFTTNTALQTSLWDYVLISLTHFNTTEQWERFKYWGSTFIHGSLEINDNLKAKSKVVPNVFGHAKIKIYVW